MLAKTARLYVVYDSGEQADKYIVTVDKSFLGWFASIPGMKVYIGPFDKRVEVIKTLRKLIKDLDMTVPYSSSKQLEEESNE